MKRIILISMLLAVVAGMKAQTANNLDYPLWRMEQGTSMAVFAEKAYVRGTPSLQGAIVDSLLPGQTLIVDSVITASPLTMKGMVTPWLKMHYTSAGKELKGYIGVALLSLGTFNKDDITFVYGLEKRTVQADKETLTVRIKAIDKDHRTIDAKEWTIDGGENARSTESKLLGEMGLDNVKEIFRLNFSGEACGLPTDYYYFGWNGTNLLQLPGKSNTVDAGAFAYTETLIFPKEPGGQPGKILKVMTTETYAEDGISIESRKTEKETYTWDGIKATRR
jgi:hypothetical protein